MKKGWGPVRIAVLPVALLLIGGVIWLYIYMTRPVSVVPHEGVKGASQTVAAVPLQTKYFASQLPGYWNIKNRALPDATTTILDSYILKTNLASATDQLGITIGKLNGTPVQGQADVVYRSQHPELFKRINLATAPSGAVAFSGLQNYETDVFFANGQEYASIALTGQSNRADQLDQTIATLLTSWRWVD